MKKILIVTSYIEGKKNEIKNLILNEKADYIICADGGYTFLADMNISADLVVGDFDSANIEPECIPCIKVPVEKDDTDLQLALKIACEKSPQKIIIIGGIGGRVDHTIGNIQNLVYYAENGPEIVMKDPYQSICVHFPGVKEYYGEKNMKFSAFAFTPQVTGVTYQGAYYPLTNHTLDYKFPLGISNEFLEDKITVSTVSGILIIVRTLL